MNQFDVEVLITPREGLLDPEGHAVQNALQSLEFEGIRPRWTGPTELDRRA